jgi:quercetin dioxygenase-like cupin family protein
MNILAHAVLPVTINISRLQQEVSGLLKSNWLPHYNSLHYTGDWNILSLRSPGGNTDNAYAELMGNASYEDTLLLNEVPYVKELLQAIQADKMAVRLMNLKAGAVIKPHTDKELSFENGEARLHIPIFTNSRVQFILDGEQLVMNEGSCWYINANLTHSVANEGTTDRIHLVIDCKVNEWLQQLVHSERTIKKVKRLQQDPAMIQQMIDALKQQDTPAAKALIETLTAQLSIQ